MQSVSVIIADDHPVVLQGLVALLADDRAFKLAATCTNGAESIEAIRRFSPDLALLDINMPAPNGLQVLRTVVEAQWPTRVIFLAASPTDDQIVAAKEGGAYGIMLKETAPDTLLNCLRTVAAGETWLPPELVDAAFERTRENRAELARVKNLLTRREIEVMLRVADGLSNKEVGQQLNISEGTVKIHLNNIYHKISVNNRTSLANFAMAYRERLAMSSV